MWFRSSTITIVVLVAWCVALSACKRVAEPAGNERALPSVLSTASAGSIANSSSSASNDAKSTSLLVAPTQRLTLPSSAYQAALYADDDAIELLTNTAAYRLLPDKEPLARNVDLGFAATVTRNHYVYWSQGRIWSEQRRSQKARRILLATLAEQPQRIVADMTADEFALLVRSEADRYSIATLEGQRVRTLYTSPGSIDALTMIGDAVYFVERPSVSNWRIASVKLSGGSTTFGADKSGRWPALLRGSREVVYYDGSRRDVLSLSPDLRHERTLAKDFICSPLAVTANVYCSTMEGIFELSGASAPRPVVPAPRQLITNLAANSRQLAFVCDAGAQGQDRLALYSVPLRP